MYEIILSDKAKKQLSKLPSNIKIRIGAVIERIKIRPFSFVKKIQGTNYSRIRIGEYRIILDIRQNKLLIFVIELGHRKNIYKN